MNLSELFAGPWGPAIVFLLRICDVSLSTVRFMLMVRDQRRYVPFIAFFEVLVWLLAAGTAIQNLQSWFHTLGFAAGFTAGTVAGMWIEGKLAFGFALVRIITPRGGPALAQGLRGLGFGVTELAGRGRQGDVAVYLSVVRRRDVDAVFQEARRRDPEAFITVEEPRVLSSGWLPGKAVP